MRLRNIPGAREEIENNEWCIKDYTARKGAWNHLFEGDGPLHLEIGMGKGRFIMELALQNPQIHLIGMEMYSSVLLRALQKRQEMEAAGSSVSNLFFVRADAREIEDIFAPGEIDRIYLNFSDPWPKERHSHRRLTSVRFLRRYEKILAPDGCVIFKTDNRELYDFSLEQAAEAGWQILQETTDLHNDPDQNRGNIMTEYEEKFSSMGKPICRMISRPGPAGCGSDGTVSPVH